MFQEGVFTSGGRKEDLQTEEANETYKAKEGHEDYKTRKVHFQNPMHSKQMLEKKKLIASVKGTLVMQLLWTINYAGKDFLVPLSQPYSWT